MDIVMDTVEFKYEVLDKFIEHTKLYELDDARVDVFGQPYLQDGTPEIELRIIPRSMSKTWDQFYVRGLIDLDQHEPDDAYNHLDKYVDRMVACLLSNMV